MILFLFLKEQEFMVIGEVSVLGLEEVVEGVAEEGVEVEEGLEGGCCGLPGVFDFGADGGDEFGRGDASSVEVFLKGFESVVDGLESVVGACADGAVEVCVGEAFEDVGAFGVGGFEEGGELALGEDDGSVEVVDGGYRGRRRRRGRRR